jgi:hypothetical protein
MIITAPLGSAVLAGFHRARKCRAGLQLLLFLPGLFVRVLRLLPDYAQAGLAFDRFFFGRLLGAEAGAGSAASTENAQGRISDRHNAGSARR